MMVTHSKSDVISPINMPAHDNSAMDGYAVRETNRALLKQIRKRVASVDRPAALG